jgi:hypothetical protein
MWKRRVRRLRALVGWKRLSFSGVPVVFGNAMPKSGSHLLLQVLEGFANIGPFVETGDEPVRTITADGRLRTTTEILSDLHRLKPGDIGWGYLRATPENVDCLCQPGWASYFILRDPRDLLVSHVFYATDLYPEHGMHEYHQRLPDIEERLKFAITGVRDGHAQLPDVAERYQRMEGWLVGPQVMVVKFEDLHMNCEKTVGAMLDHLGSSGYHSELDRSTAVHLVISSVDPQKSPTFRKGRTGEWRIYFDDEHKRLFKEVAGDLLVRLGYEKDNDW